MDMKIEFRWAVSPHTTTNSPILQYREGHYSLQYGWMGGDWQDVPTVVVDSLEMPRTRLA